MMIIDTYNDGHSSGVDNPSEMSELSDLRARLITAHMRLEKQRGEEDTCCRAQCHHRRSRSPFQRSSQQVAGFGATKRSPVDMVRQGNIGRGEGFQSQLVLESHVGGDEAGG
jgi:hypothetical protein